MVIKILTEPHQFPNSPVHFHDWKIPQRSVRVSASVDHGMGEEGITSRDPPNMEQMREWSEGK